MESIVRVFAVGQEATGIIAIGQVATGVIAIGQIATGVIAVGQLARGVFVVGQLGFGAGYSLGMLGVAPGYAVGMLAIGGRTRGMMPVSLIPTRARDADAPITVPLASVLDGTTASGWIDARLAMDGPRTIARAGGREIALTYASDEIERDMRAALADKDSARAWMLVRATEEVVADAAGYRATPATERVLVCEAVRARPHRKLSALAGLVWVARLAALAGLAALWWFLAGDPLLQVLSK